ncbi:ArsR family transcriptional regulator [Massilia sp. Root133]|uniref:Metalloregulator ArsR/SmtB family transcription factor n=1 Tax=Massilia cellulosiltytica TaxID=2683234 RepID=A0A7X3G2X5_9BURK|nr:MULTISPECIES: metalloregulator ArsR/SmtB family transcription factor [Telluria group]KQY01687.1 ArsR family transcriptional regulator [Massilia sp. Root133]KQZ38824.1 ArsR family transcriptional regulator [Massilia sp. Root1485]MVW62533.1 metalloregulator ArsR/SmtB family transcription factor [Telluria cellulosilytica]
MSKSCCPPAPERARTTEFDADDLARMCKALSHPARVQLLRHLIDHGECYFGNLADVLPLAPSTISQHVTILKEAGLIEGSADVQRVCYCVNRDRLAQLKQAIGAL